MVFVSHPFAMLLSQSANPGWHERMTQAPLEHPGDPWIGVAQSLPHLPQLLTSKSTCTSQPLPGLLSQSA